MWKLNPKWDPKVAWDGDPETGEFVPQYQVQKDDKGKPIKDASGKPLLKLDASGKPLPEEAKNSITGEQQDPLGRSAAGSPAWPPKLRQPGNWMSIIGVIGLLLAFGHSILAMSGEETLAQVYREVESPKMKNFKKAAFIVFVYSLVLTAGISFLAVMLIPDEVRMKTYSDNLIGGLAMYMAGPLIGPAAVERLRRGRRLPDSGRRGEHGDHRLQRRVEPRRRRRRHARLVPQAAPPLRHDVPHSVPDRRAAIAHDPPVAAATWIVLGEAYAFGVVWSFVFKALAMVVLRFKDRTPARVQGAA